jgi:uncharacterized protein DUF4190
MNMVRATHSAPVPQQRSSGKAITALVLGIIGLFGIFVLSVLAIIFGALGRGDTDRDPTLGGRGMATAGLVLGMVGLVLTPLWYAVLYG